MQQQGFANTDKQQQQMQPPQQQQQHMHPPPLPLQQMQKPPTPSSTPQPDAASATFGENQSTGGRADAFQAFAALALGDHNKSKEETPPTAAGNAEPSTEEEEVQAKKAPTSKYKAGQILCYRNNGNSSSAEIVKVHFDDALEPYYSIMLPDGTEKQTDDAHLSFPEASPTRKEIEQMLVVFHKINCSRFTTL